MKRILNSVTYYTVFVADYATPAISLVAYLVA